MPWRPRMMPPVGKSGPGMMLMSSSMERPGLSISATQASMTMYENAGVNGIIVTVDQTASFYERTQQDRNFGGRAAPLGGRGATAGRGAAAGGIAPLLTGSAKYRINGGRLFYTWQYIDAIRKMIKGPLIIKGILDPEDAKLAIEHGADSVIVSNHGGRSMDYGPSSLEVLPEIVAAVNGRIPVIFDSGIRRGADIFKALALGASAVNLGRAARWGLAAYGADGVQGVVEMLQTELARYMCMCGRPSLAAVDPSLVRVHANLPTVTNRHG